MEVGGSPYADVDVLHVLVCVDFEDFFHNLYDGGRFLKA